MLKCTFVSNAVCEISWKKVNGGWEWEENEE